jgi:hypothetical protein
MSVNRDMKDAPKFDAKETADKVKKQKRAAFWNKYVWPTAEAVFGAIASVAMMYVFVLVMVEACTPEPSSFHKPVVPVNPCSDYTVEQLEDGEGEGCTH